MKKTYIIPRIICGNVVTTNILAGSDPSDTSLLEGPASENPDGSVMESKKAWGSIW